MQRPHDKRRNILYVSRALSQTSDSSFRVFAGFCLETCGTEPHSRVWLSEMTHLKCLAVRTLDTRHVRMNHAMQHMAPTVLFARLLLLAQSDACCLWPAMAPDDEARHAGFLELQSRACQRDWRAVLPIWNFTSTSVTVCAFNGTMQSDGPISQKNGLSKNVFFFFFSPPLQWFPWKNVEVQEE